MSVQPEHVLVVGAGLGGLRTAEQLRAAGHQGRISLVGAEPHAPYDRPPLSKQVLTGEWEPSRATLRDVDGLDELGVRSHLGSAAVALRHHGAAGPGRGRCEVELADGATLHGDVVVVATGVTARRLPDQPSDVHTLRTLDDALALRAALDRIGSLLIVGGGFVGAEVASAARARGVSVTVLEALAQPAERALGPLGTLAARLMTDAGVDLRTGVRTAGFVGSPGAATGVRLDDGTELRADAVLVGVGGEPQLGWLTGAGDVDVSDGLACGPTGRVHGLPGVWAVGDVACWDGHRTEHWTNAGDQAAAVAHDVLGVDPPPATVPYFWSDQFGLKLQLVGRPDTADSVLALHGEGLDGGAVRGTVAGYLAGERLVAVAGFGAARYVARYRGAVADGVDRAAVLSTAASLAR